MNQRRCNCPTFCKYCGAELKRDPIGHYCPTKNCQFHQGVSTCPPPSKKEERECPSAPEGRKMKTRFKCKVCGKIGAGRMPRDERGMTGAIETDTYIPVKTIFRLLGFYCKKKGCENVVEHGLTRWCPEHRVEAYERAQKRFKKRSNPLGLK